MKSRFLSMLQQFGWQGGTIHQVNREIELTLSLPLRSVDIYDMSEEEFWDIQAEVDAVMNSRGVA
jgi:hypothetical protein